MEGKKKYVQHDQKVESKIGIESIETNSNETQCLSRINIKVGLWTYRINDRKRSSGGEHTFKCLLES